MHIADLVRRQALALALALGLVQRGREDPVVGWVVQLKVNKYSCLIGRRGQRFIHLIVGIRLGWSCVGVLDQNICEISE